MVNVLYLIQIVKYLTMEHAQAAILDTLWTARVFVLQMSTLTVLIGAMDNVIDVQLDIIQMQENVT